MVGVSYAYFRLQIEGSGNDIVLDTGDLRLRYTDGKEITLSNAMPGDSVSKTVTVENIGTTFTKGIYTYSYKQGGMFNPMAQDLEWHDMDENGWGVQLNDKTSTTPITEVPCTYINNIPIVNTSSMFAMSEATSIDLSNFNTSNVVYMDGMFIDAYETTLDLSSFDTSNVTDMSGMFSNCKSLKSIYVSDKFNVSNVTSSDSMFTDSTNLVGGNGTKYDSSHTDKEYARIDTTDTPGYFTKK